jgi:short-subunit dehydrogenase
MAGFLRDTGFGAYTASKFAVVGISEALSAELEQQGIGVSILCPG